jgi:hypothetical protein
MTADLRLGLRGGGRLVRFQHEPEWADAGDDVRLQLDARDSNTGNPYSVVALEINENVAAALQTDLGMRSRDALGGVLQDDIVLRSAPDADGQLLQWLSIACLAS